MNILLLGKTGLLGSEFLRILEQKSRDIPNLQYIAPSRADFDISDPHNIDDLLIDNKFNFIINCVAFTDVEKAETQKEECREINVFALENLIRYEIPIIHFSTDYVFNGTKEDIITEKFARNPLNVYGQSKMEAEILLENFAEKWWNIRTSWLFGSGGKNFITNILEKSRDNDEIEIVSDEIGRPTYAKNLAEFVFDNFISKEQPTGHYHLQNSGEPTSWADFANFFLRDNNIKTGIKKINANKLKRKAQRPKNSVLKNTKLKQELVDWKESVRDFLS